MFLRYQSIDILRSVLIGKKFNNPSKQAFFCTLTWIYINPLSEHNAEGRFCKVLEAQDIFSVLVRLCQIVADKIGTLQKKPNLKAGTILI